MDGSSPLGVVFLHHTIDEVVQNNLRSVRIHNPDVTIVSVSAGDVLPNGYSIEATPQIKRAHSTNSARGSDRLVCSWFIQRKEQCDKWWIIEWDTFCKTSVRDYYRPVWHFPFVAASVRLRYREPEWVWFAEARELPSGYRPHVIGGVPFLYLMSEQALYATCNMLLTDPFTCANGELRFATAANRCGFSPCGYSPPDDQITWSPRQHLADRPAIFHPVKHLIPLDAEFASARSLPRCTG